MLSGGIVKVHLLHVRRYLLVVNLSIIFLYDVVISLVINVNCVQLGMQLNA